MYEREVAKKREGTGWGMILEESTDRILIIQVDGCCANQP